MASQSSALLSHSASRLPADVVRQILSSNSDSFATRLSTSEPSEFPWFLGHICSAWRTIFLSMSTYFWSDINISLEEEEDSVKRTENIVRFFLERDPAAPFSFTLRLWGPLSTFHDMGIADHVQRILDMLVDASMRWRGASFASHPQDLLPLIRAKNRLPLLQTIDLRFEFDFYEVPDQLLEVFQNTPSLNVVTTLDLAGWKFNWANLKSINMLKPGSGSSHFIAALPQMEKLELLSIAGPFECPAPTGAIRLPSLTVLRCESCWLSFLETPALKKLTINYVSDGYESDTILSFLDRSRCNRNISFLCVKFAEAVTVTDILRHTPDIVELNLESIEDMGNVFGELAVSTNQAQEPLARHMQSLSIEPDPDESFDDERRLFDLVSARTGRNAAGNGCEKLQTLVIPQSAYYDTEILGDVIALCEERGVQCHITLAW